MRAPRTPDRRLACLSEEDRAMFAGRSAQELVDHCDSLLQQEERIRGELDGIGRRRRAVEVLARRAMRRDRRESVTTRRHDGSVTEWRPHPRRTGFRRISRELPGKPDAGAG